MAAPERLIQFTVVLTFIFGTTRSLPEIIKIGGLFDMTDTVQEIAFRYAVDRVNVRSDILPRSRLTAQIERIPQRDSFYASKQVCKALKAGMAGLFGPQSSSTSSHVQSICDTLEIPHIETRWDYRMKREDYSVNLYPHPLALGQAYVAMITAMNWKSFVVLYEESEGLVRLQEVLKLSSVYNDIQISVRQLIPSQPGDDYRPLLKQIKEASETRIILDCKTDSIFEILKQAQQVGVMTAYHNYFITSLDLHMVELEDFKYGGTNISALRMVDPSDDSVREVVQDWVKGEMRFNRKIPFAGKTIRTETALVYDAVQMFAKALTDLDRSQDVQTSSIDCGGRETWQHGNSLVNYMKMVELQGLTGKIQFDTLGFRSNFDLDIIELKKEGLVKVGSWSQEFGANFTRNFTESYTEIVESLHNKTLKITTILNEPYTMLVEDEEARHGNDRFEGYNVDLIRYISEVLKFNYTIHIVKDRSYGSYNEKNDTWNGMIGELLSQQADLAVADLTITYEREQGVDFTMPFMNLGVTILFKKPTAKDPNLFSFLSPLSLAVWVYIITAYLIVSLVLYMLARFSPYEKGFAFTNNGKTDQKGSRLAKPDPIYETLFSGANGRLARTVGTQVSVRRESKAEAAILADRPEEEMTFTLLNSFWFMIASLLQQGTDLLPRAVSTRMVAGMWWFFTLIMISSYTANLAAFLTVERMESPIESAEDLSKQSTIKYGCYGGGSTAAFFRDSKIPTYSRMWVFMDSDDTNFVGSNKEGIERVARENGKYAFLMESTTVEYIVERQCDLTQIGGLLDSKGYGIALPPNSPYRTPISSAILQLQEGGKLHILKEKWWKQRKGGGKCKEVQESGAAALGIYNVGGVFVVLISGLFLACIVAYFESLWDRRAQRRAALLQASISQQSTCNTETTTGTLTRCGASFGDHLGRTTTIPFENGHVTHLDLAAVHPRGGGGGVITPHHHARMPERLPGVDIGGGGFMSSSISAAALESCAVPMMDLGQRSSGGGVGGGGGPPLIHSSSLGWVSNNGGSGTLGRSVRYQHQEECPHYNGFKEAPT